MFVILRTYKESIFNNVMIELFKLCKETVNAIFSLYQKRMLEKHINKIFGSDRVYK